MKTHPQEPKFPIVYLMEATGDYYETPAWFLHHLDWNVTVIIPKTAKHYFKSLGIKSKNDKIDARGLAFMAAQ